MNLKIKSTSKDMTMGKKILFLLLLISGTVFSQTTVSLQDQCNCEVLSGTAVTSPGAATPTGADVGDIYVNTNTGIIYFWDGNSWELTSSDDQQLQSFSFNPASRVLSLQIENGNTVSVDLSFLNNTGTDDQVASEVLYNNTVSGLLAGNVQEALDEINAAASAVALVDNSDGTYTFTDADGTVTVISDTSISTLINNGDGTYTYTDESNTVQTIDTNASSNPYDNTVSGLFATNVQAAIDEVNAAAGTVALVDNGDGTYDFTDASGNVTTITDTSISTLVDNGDGSFTYTAEDGTVTIFTETLTTLVDNNDGTFTYTNEDGTPQLVRKADMIDNFDGTYTFTNFGGTTLNINTNAISNPYDNTVSGLFATNVQAAIDEVNAAAGTVALVDNGDGTYDFTDASGTITTITDTSISTLVNNGDGTYTYTDESGATQSIDTNASSNPYDNTTSGLLAANVQDAIDEVNAAAGTVALVDNGDGTYDFTDASGNVTTITDTSISTLLDNGDGSFTYTAEDGTVTIFTETLTTLVDNNDGTFTYTNEDGTPQLVRKADMIDNFDGTYTFTNFGGTTLNINTNAISNPYDNTASGLLATNVQSAIDEVNAAAGTVALVDNGDGTYDFTDSAGNVTTITDTSVSTLVNNGDGTYTYTDESGATQSIDTNASSNPYNNAISGLAATNVQSAIDEVNAAAGTVALVDNGDGTYDFTDAAGNVTTITDTSISTLVNNGDGTYTYTDESGATQSIDTNASSNPYNNAISGLSANNVQAAIDEVNAAAGTVALVDNGDGTYDFTDAAGNVTTITDTSVSTLVNNGDGTYTYTDESGATQSIDTNASSNPYNNAISGLAATNVQSAIDEVNAAAGTVALVDNGDGTYDFTDASGTVTTITDTSISTLVNNGDGTYTYTDESGATQSIDTNASSNPYNNAISGLAANNVQAAIDEVNAAAGTVALVDNGDGTYDFTDASGTVTTITDTSISTLVDNADGSFTYTAEDGTVTIFTETLTTLVDNNNGTFTYTNEDGTPQLVRKADMIDNFDGTYTFTNFGGTTLNINTNAISNPYDNTASGLLATDVQSAIDEVNAAAGTVALVDNGDGTYDFTDASGTVTTITDTSVSTLVNNGDGTYTYTDESGATQSIDTNASSNPYNNAVSGLLANDVQAAIDEVVAGSSDDQVLATDGTAGNISIEAGNSLSLNVDDSDADPTNEFNTGIATTAGALEVTDGGGTVSANLVSADANNDIVAGTDGALYLNVASVSMAETVTNLVDNGNGTITYTNEDGTPQTVNKADITDNGDGTYLFTNNDGSDVLLDTRASTNPYDNTASGLLATDVQAAIDEINAAAATVALVDNGNGTYDFTDAAGNVTTITDTSVSTLVDNGDGTYTYTDETGATQSINTNASSNPYDNTTSGLVATDVQAAIDEVNAAAGTVALVDNGNGTYDFTDAAGNVTTITDTSISTLTDNGDGSFTYTAEDGTVTIFTETLTTLVDNADGTFTYTNEDGTAQTVRKADMIDNFDGTYTFTNFGATLLNIDTNASSNPYDNTTSGLLAGNVQDAIDEMVSASSDDQNISGSGLLGTDLTIGIENGASEVIDLSSLVGTDDQTAAEVTYDNTASGLLAADTQAAIDEIVANSTDDQQISTTGAAGNITIEDGNTLNLNVDDADADPTNEFNTGSGINAGALEITDGGGTESINLISADANNDIVSGTDGALYLNVASVTISETITNIVDNTDGTFTYTNESGAAQTISKADVTDNGDGTYTFTNNDGTDVVINTVDADADTTNELQTISRAGTDVTLSDGGGTVSIADNDNDSTNEIELPVGGAGGQVLSTDGAGNYSWINDNGGTDDQTAAEVTYDNTTSGLLAGNTQAAIDELVSTSSDDQNISGSNLTGTDLTIGIENGTSEVISLASLVDDADADPTNEIELPVGGAGGQVLSTDGAGNYSWINDNGGSDDQNLTAATLNASNILQIDIENGTSTTVDLSSLDDSGTDDQNISGSNLTGTDLTIGIENGTSEVISLAALVDDADADPNNEFQTISRAGTDVTLSDGGGTISIADNDNDSTNEIELPVGGSGGQVLSTDGAGNYSWINDNGGTDDQTAAEVTYDNTTSGLLAGNTQAAIDELVSTSSDDQNISGSGLAGTVLTIGIENGTDETVDLATINTDDQTLSTSGAAGNISIEDGNTLNLNVDDADADATNEFNTGLGMNAGSVQLTDGGGTLSTSLISTDANNDLAAGTDGALYLNVASVTISETVTNIVDNTDGTFTYTNESGAAQTISKADVTDNGDGTYIFTNNDGTDVVINTVDADADTTNELQTISRAGTDVTLSDGGGTVSIADNDNDSTNEIELPVGGAGGQVLSTDGAGNYSWINDNGGSDDQNISGSGLAGTVLTIGIENGTNETVDLATINTDDQNISGSNLTGTDLTIGIENGTSEVISLASLVDDADADPTNEIELPTGGAGGQVLSTDGAGNYSWINDNGGTDDQTAAEVTYDNSTSGLLAGNTQAAIDELVSTSSDDQNISGSNLTGTDLTIGIENGTSEVISLADLVDDADADPTNEFQTISRAGTDVTLSDGGGTISIADNDNDSTNEIELPAGGAGGQVLSTDGAGNYSWINDNGGTDDQNLTAATLNASNILQIDIENGTSTTVDLSSLDNSGTDDQNISGSNLTGTDLTIGIENGTSEVISLAALVDDADADPTNEIELPAGGAGGQVLSTDGAGNYSWINDNGGTDSQTLSLAGNNLSISNGNTVDISSIDTDTDDQTLSLAGNTLSIADGNSVDLSSFNNSGTDDQNISGSGLAGTVLTIGIENGTNETVDLATINTDDQGVDTFNFNGVTNQLTLEVEADGQPAHVVDLSALDNSGTDDQTLSTTGAAGNISIEDGNTLNLNVDDADADASNELQTISRAGTDLTLSNGGGTVSIADNDNDSTNEIELPAGGAGGQVLSTDGAGNYSWINDNGGTDDQTAAEVTYDNTTSGLLAGNTQAAIDEIVSTSSDDQNISGSGLAGTVLTIGIENGTNETVDLATINTDDQNISGSNLTGTNLTIGIENGTSEVISLASLVDDADADPTNEIELPAGGAGGQVLSTDGAGNYSWINDNGGTDSQTLSLAGNNLSISNGNTIDISSIDTDTDDQTLSLAGNTLSIADGNSVDLSSFNNSGTDDQNISGSNLTGTNLTIGIENGTSEVISLASLVDDADADASNELQTISRAGTDVTLSNGGGTVSIADNDNDSTNEIELPAGGSGGQVLSTDGAGNYSWINDNGGSDDQNISGSGLAGTVLTIGIENGTNETVDLATINTDDQGVDTFSFNGVTNQLTLEVEADGQAAHVVDLSALDNSGTDDQTLSTTGAAGNISIEDGNTLNLNVDDADADASNELQTISRAGTDLTLSNGGGTVSIADNDNDSTNEIELPAGGAGGQVLSTDGAGNYSWINDNGGTDSQTLSLAGSNLSISNGNTIDISSIDTDTDDQTLSLAGNTLSIADGNSVDLTPFNNSGTDDQNISGSGLAGTNLTIGIENGTSEVVDLSSLLGTDDQNLTGASLNGSNILQIDIENGNSATVDLSSLDNSGTDDQTAAEVSYDNTTSGLTATNTQAAIDEVVANSSDDQYDDEVPLRTPIDMDEAEVASPTLETNVEEVIQAIAPITSKAARIFYPPSIAVDASTNGSFSVDLYAQYTAQFATPAVASTGAPAAVPTYAAGELYYYVTYADPAVFANMSIDANGVLSYDIIGQPSDYNSLINVVFVVK